MPTAVQNVPVGRVASEELLEQIDRVWRRSQRFEHERNAARTPQQEAAMKQAVKLIGVRYPRATNKDPAVFSG